jgi:hypothetical protein
MVLVSFIEYPFTAFEKVIVPSKRREEKVIVINMIYTGRTWYVMLKIT